VLARLVPVVVAAVVAAYALVLVAAKGSTEVAAAYGSTVVAAAKGSDEANGSTVIVGSVVGTTVWAAGLVVFCAGRAACRPATSAAVA
jgi:hypothetical protein